MHQILPITTLLSDFEPGSINKDELENMIKDLVKSNEPEREVDSINYTDDGIIVILDNEETIDISIDWDEIIIED
ncbi:MAG: hypothetical protein WC523_00085 [Patescibacteria group bacterium]